MKSSLICFLLAVVSMTVQAAPESIANVNGKVITKAVVDALVHDQGLQGKPQEGEFREYAKGQLIQREVMAQQALALKLDKAPELQKNLGLVQQDAKQRFPKASPEELEARASFATQSLLMQAFIDDVLKKKAPTEAALRDAYKRITQGKGGTEYKVRHIQLASEADAKAVIAKLAGGAKFEALAAESLDLGSKDNGGDLGWLKAEGFPAPFAAAVGKLAAGSYTRAPVKTDMGYHVILVEGSRAVPVGSFDSYKAEITESLQQQALNKEVEALMKKAKIR